MVLFNLYFNNSELFCIIVLLLAISSMKEKNLLVRAMQLVTNITYQIFYPVEHIYWLTNKNILTSFVSWKWVVGSILAWAVALMADIVRWNLTFDKVYGITGISGGTIFVSFVTPSPLIHEFTILTVKKCCIDYIYHTSKSMKLCPFHF